MLQFSSKEFTSLIKKINLNSTIESAIIDINNNELVTNFMLDDNSLKGKLIQKKFEYDDSKFAFMELSSLLKLLSVLDENIKFELKKSLNKCKVLELNDNVTILKVVLTDPDLLPTVTPNVKIPSSDRCVTLTLTSDILSKFSKSISALNKCEKFSIYSDALTNVVNISFKENSSVGSIYSNSMDDNTLSYNFNVYGTNRDISITEFYADTFKNIIDANKENESCKLTFYEAGLLQIEFDNEHTNVKYYLISLS